jgi:hypothetical protein
MKEESTMPSPTGWPTAADVMRGLGLVPDPWQLEVLQSQHPRLLLNCARQSGKSTVVAVLALVEAIRVPGTKVVLLSRSHRQSTQLFRTLTGFFRRLGSPLLARQTQHELELANLSWVVCLPCREDTVRGYSDIRILVLDEAARVPDDLYRAVRPMLAVSRGRLICLSTPYGKRGFFYDAWANGGNDWHRIEVPAQRIARISPETLAQERRALGESWFRQEFCCSFEALEGLVYPDFARCLLAGAAPEGGTRLGGLDFGFRNPFAAVWGTLKDDVLTLTGEHYCRGKPLSHHAAHLPRDVMWYADPSGANEREELRWAGFKVREGSNSLRPGIAAVSARLEDGGLRVLEGRCPNLLAEAGLYRYGDEGGERNAETPVDEHNHALAALRYLISGLDRRKLARGRRPATGEPPPADEAQAREKKRPWLRLDNPFLWEGDGVWRIG